jgi:NADPH:quinone reductase-like Zn-dependent oxidoreductase/predicted ester cyclase
MKSYHVNLGAGLDGLVVKEHDIPVPGPREVLIRVRACSLNFRELMILIRGFYPLPVRPDVVPVSDGAGEVVAVGAGVSRAKVGDRVVGAVFPYWIDGSYTRDAAAQLGGSLNGMLTEYALLPEEGVVHIPGHLSFEQAATLPCAGVTAWNALTGGRILLAGDTVLTLGSGGVSLFTLQFAKLFGTRVIATTSSEEKAERLKALGADAVINYRTTPDWHVAVRELTAGQGVDHVVEVGGPGTIVQSIKSTRVSGEVAMVAGSRLIGRYRYAEYRLGGPGHAAEHRDRQPRPVSQNEPRDRRKRPEAGHRPRVSVRGGKGCLPILSRGAALREGDHQSAVRADRLDSHKTRSRNADTRSKSTMSTEHTKEIIRRYRAAHTTNELDQLDEIVAADLITHNLLPGLPPGLAGGKMAHTLTLASFPDYSVITEGDLIAEGDKVVERWTCGGTFTGAPYFGTPATGKRFCVTGISIYRIAQGKIVEHWAEADFLGAAQQLGTLPSMS